MMPIPKRMLPHEVTYQKRGKTDRWGNSEETIGTKIKYVKVEPTTKIVRDKNNAEVKLSAMLFYDCKNSSPKGVSFARDDIIVFQGAKHKVQIVESLYDNKQLHH